MASTVVTAPTPACTQLDPNVAPALADSNTFFWSYTEEPHRTRRQAIIKTHPEVHDPEPCRLFSAHKFRRLRSFAGQSH